MRTRPLPASAAHERMMLNLALFHILLPIVALASGIMLAILLPALLGSVLSIAWIGWHARHHPFPSETVKQHWLLAWRHCRWLLLAYAVSALIMLLGFIVSQLQADPNMGTIMLVVFSRIAAVPTLLMVLMLFVLETSALADSRKLDLNQKETS